MPGTKNSGGRNAIGTQQHVLRGTFQPSRHAGHETPEPPKGRPEPPNELTGEAKAEWDRMLTRLELTGALSRVDDAAVYQYCHLWAETEALAISREEVGSSVDILEDNLAGLKGTELVQAFQEISKMRQLDARYSAQIRQGRMAVRQYLIEFGLTPSARTRVKLPPAKPVVDPKKARYA